ncbi:hypothetical protein SLS58_010988 [Diplodia intermedia]|uniref:RGS domain-containing protein n=1 Tax=Diplodia intermedia TaxID=856260 RepID=A0ABR3T2Y8_9PEZI
MSAFSATQLVPETFQALDFPDGNEPGEGLSSSVSANIPSIFDQADGNENGEAPHCGYDLMPPPPNLSSANAEHLADRLFSADHLNLILRHQPAFSKFTKFLNKYRPRSAPTLVRYLETRKAKAAIEYANSIALEMTAPEKRSSASALAAHISNRFETRSQRAAEELINDALPAYITNSLTQLVTELLVKDITGTSAPMNRHLAEGLAEVYCLGDPSLPDSPVIYASEAPLYDNTGKLRYFIGCQIDVTNLVEGGRSLESFALLLDQDEESLRQSGSSQRGSLKALGDLGELLSTEETEVLKQKRRNPPASSRASTPAPATTLPASNRRYVGIEDPLAINIWPPTQFGHHGRLPGVYQNFLLVRPWPSLRILFTSAALRIPGLAQSRLLDRIGGPHSVREGIAAAFAEGARVTAKVSWLTGNINHNNNVNVNNGGRGDSPHQHMRSSSIEGKPRYIHCTPLHGSDGAPGVWMVVMVEKEDITGTINASYNHNRRRRSSFGIVNGTYAQEKLFDQSQQVQQPHQYRMREPEGRDAVGGGGSTRRSRAQSTFYDDYNDDSRSMPASSAYAEYLASSAATTNGAVGGGGAVRSGSASRGPSRPPSRAATTGTSSWPPRPESTPPRKMTPREETARMVRLPVFPPERLGEVDGE